MGYGRTGIVVVVANRSTLITSVPANDSASGVGGGCCEGVIHHLHSDGALTDFE